MKKKVLLAVVALMTSTAVFAQFTESGGSSSALNGVFKSGFGGFVQYNNLDMGDYALGDASGIGVGYSAAFGLSRHIPLYIETAPSVNWYFKNKTIEGYDEGYDEDYYEDYKEDYKVKFNLLSVNVPVNIGYRFAIGESGFAIEPYTGLYARINALGKMKPGGESIDIFDDDDMDGDAASRVQVGWDIGANFVWKNIYLGISYGADFNKFLKIWDEDNNPKDLKLKTFNVTFGVKINH